MRIVPIKILESTATQILFGGINVYPDKGYADTVWRLLDDAGNEILGRSLRIDGEDYAKWGTDDDYIISVICAKAGVVVDKVPKVDKTEEVK